MTTTQDQPFTKTTDGNGPKTPVATTTATPDEGPSREQILVVLQSHDIPATYWGAFETYCRTGAIKGGEFRARLSVLKQFSDCLKELRALSSRDFPTGDGFSRETFN
jgi:hypothetical protein